MARENPTWGYTRIRGALRNIGLDVGRSTIARILKSNGLDPAPERVRIPSWKTFLEAHRGAVAAADLFTVEVLTMRGLIRHYVFFVIDVTTRCVQVAGITRQPDGPWMARMAAHLTDAYDGILLGKRVLITDRDPLYTARFRGTLEAAGTSIVRIPPRSPHLNAFAERFVRSIKSECLRHIVTLSERHLRETVREYVEHYNTERNHQGIGNVIPLPSPERSASPDAPVIRRKRLGGLLSYYHREAA
jgi:transposase InsO family protein